MSAWQYHEGKPSAVGWYAVVLCWDAEEGLFPDADYWDGGAWRQFARSIVAFSPQTFGSEEVAAAWARENDPEGIR